MLIKNLKYWRSSEYPMLTGCVGMRSVNVVCSLSATEGGFHWSFSWDQRWKRFSAKWPWTPIDIYIHVHTVLCVCRGLVRNGGWFLFLLLCVVLAHPVTQLSAGHSHLHGSEKAARVSAVSHIGAGKEQHTADTALEAVALSISYCRVVWDSILIRAQSHCLQQRFSE